jgi:hypothetical protein
VVRRETPADTDLQSQIEWAIRDATGESLTWPELSRPAGDALPVVMREAALDRPVAVIVTSRIAVADRVQIPASGAYAVKLDPFDDAQVERRLSVWNDANETSLRSRGLTPLPARTVRAHPQLSAQPLLLLMLALYDSDGNALQRAIDDLGGGPVRRPWIRPRPGHWALRIV